MQRYDQLGDKVKSSYNLIIWQPLEKCIIGIHFFSIIEKYSITTVVDYVLFSISCIENLTISLTNNVDYVLLCTFVYKMLQYVIQNYKGLIENFVNNLKKK